MAGSVVLNPASVSVTPGTMGICAVRVRNTGVVVDQFSLTVLGQPAVWATAVPAVLSLFPGAEGIIEVHFAPPRAATVGFGPLPFAVRVDASQDADGSVVEEGEVDLLAFTELQAKITPRTSEAKRKARHEVLLDNRGNTAVEAELEASDPDELLAFDLKPRVLSVPAGQTARASVNVAAKNSFLRGTDKHRPFQVRVRPEGAQPPINLEANLVQKAGMPSFILPLAAAVVVIGLLALVLPTFKKDPANGKLSLTSEEGTTTTIAGAAAVPEGVVEDPNAPATPEEQAAAAEAERAANGQDAGGSTSGGGVTGRSTGGDTSTAGGGSEGGTTSGGGVVNGSDDSSAVTSPPATAAPPTSTPSTTAAPAGSPTTTTTIVPSKEATVRGTWTYDLKAGVEGGGTADFWWEIYDATTRWLTPQNGAVLSNMGLVDYESITLKALQSLTYSGGKIVASDKGNMPIGTVIAFKTTNGKFAKFKVLAKEPHPSNKLTFRYYVYP